MARKATIFVGDVFGRLTVTEKVRCAHDGRHRWMCRCECGVELLVDGRVMQKTGARPCICARKAEIVRQQALKTERAKNRETGGAVAGRAKIVPEQPMPVRMYYVNEPTAHTMRLYGELPANLQAAVKADVNARLRAHRDCGVRVESVDRLYLEAIEIARIEGDAPPQERERFEPAWSYGVYQSPKGA